MRSLALSIRQSFPRLFPGTSALPFAMMLLLFAPLLPAQVRWPRELVPLRRMAAPIAKKVAKPQELPSLAYMMPLSLGRENSSLSRVSSYTLPAKSYRVPVNFDLLLPQPLRTAEVGAKTAELGVRTADLAATENRFLSQASSDRLTFAPTYASDFTAVPAEAANHGGDPEYYARHIPLVGGLAMHLLQQSKAHPRITRVFQVIQPQLF